MATILNCGLHTYKKKCFHKRTTFDKNEELQKKFLQKKEISLQTSPYLGLCTFGCIKYGIEVPQKRGNVLF